MPSEHSSAEEITRASQSNLAFAFVSLGKARRRDITIFYAFCRLIDDIADSAELAAEEKARRLALWREALHGPVAQEPPLAPEVRGLINRYPITPAMLEEIMDGVEMDLTISRYETFAALREYCYRGARAPSGSSALKFLVTKIRPAANMRSSLGSPSRSPTSCATWRKISPTAAFICPGKT